MTASPTPEQSARAILDIFKSRNCYAGDRRALLEDKMSIENDVPTDRSYASTRGR